MNKKEKIFLIIVIIIIIMLNIRNMTIIRHNNGYDILKDKSDCIDYITFVEGRHLPKNTLMKIDSLVKLMTNKNDKEYLNNNYIVCTIFATIGCKTCLRKEMENIDSLYTVLKFKNISPNVVGLVSTDNISELLRFKRVSNIHFPLYIDDADSIISYLKLKAFPVTILIDRQNGFIIKAIHPLKNDDLFSKKFYKYVINMLNVNDDKE